LRRRVGRYAARCRSSQARTSSPAAGRQKRGRQPLRRRARCGLAGVGLQCAIGARL